MEGLLLDTSSQEGGGRISKYKYVISISRFVHRYFVLTKVIKAKLQSESNIRSFFMNEPALKK